MAHDSKSDKGYWEGYEKGLRDKAHRKKPMENPEVEGVWWGRGYVKGYKATNITKESSTIRKLYVREVTTCEDCPRRAAFNHTNYCKESHRYIIGAGIPDWCPLEDVLYESGSSE